ncbi:MAG TPA: hypothetical protein VJ691_14680, partial [Vicinamibacterales bacterium]|nr:hypothetical protein [Vicinamibacterales bacterium]
MPSPRIRMFLLMLLIGGAAIHITWSSVMAWLWASGYSQRIIDVRRWPEEVDVKRTAEMVSMYLTHTVLPSSPPTTVFFGSSVAFGYPWQKEAGFAARYAALRPSEHVFNASVIGADVAFIENAI